MTKLFGVDHMLDMTYIVWQVKLAVTPSNEMLTELRKIPSGTKVAVEWFKDPIYVENHLRRLLANSKAKARYLDCSDSYWDAILSQCRQAGHEVIYLENDSTWEKYNRSIVNYAKKDKALKSLMKSCKKPGAKLYAACEDVWKAQMESDRIWVLQREKDFLSIIGETNPGVVIVGTGHADYWMASRSYESQLSFRFDSYSQDRAMHYGNDLETMRSYSTFIRNALPDKTALADRKNLERKLSVLDGNLLTDKKPDHYGTWNLTKPSEGYFEMFVEEMCDGVIRGTIEDCLGSATFSGSKTNSQIDFWKHYTDPTTDAGQNVVYYMGNVIGNEIVGDYFLQTAKKPFYMSLEKRPATEIVRRWLSLLKTPAKT